MITFTKSFTKPLDKTLKSWDNRLSAKMLINKQIAFSQEKRKW